MDRSTPSIPTNLLLTCPTPPPIAADIKYINGYDDPEIVAGAGTIGIEVLEQIASADYVIVPVGGAGACGRVCV